MIVCQLNNKCFSCRSHCIFLQAHNNCVDYLEDSEKRSEQITENRVMVQNCTASD